MSQVAKSASALERAFLAILELEAMVVRLFRSLKLADIHGDGWTVRQGTSRDVRCPVWRLTWRWGFDLATAQTDCHQLERVRI